MTVSRGIRATCLVLFSHCILHALPGAAAASWDEPSINKENSGSSRKGKSDRAMMTVRLSGGDIHGSGVIVRHLQQDHWLIVTTGHVLLDQRRDLCVGFRDGATAPAVVIHANQEPRLDLAFLVTRATPSRPITAARLDQSRQKPGLPVIAAGFPAGSDYQEQRGRLVRQPEQALRGGYRLAYTSDVQKGMSGGGIFTEENLLIGINALHASPLWSAPLHYIDGSPVSPQETERLERLALGLTAQAIIRELDRLPSAVIHQGMQRLSSRTSTSCGEP